MRRSIIALALCLAVSAARAEEDLRRDLAAELTEVMQVRKTIEDSFAMVRQVIPQQMKATAAAAGHPESAEASSHMADRVMDVVSTELGWDKIKEEYIALYVETFTEDELKGLIAFYKSPAGQAFVAKQPELMRRSVQINQRIMASVMPKLQEMLRESRTAAGATPVTPPAPLAPTTPPAPETAPAPATAP